MIYLRMGSFSVLSFMSGYARGHYPIMTTHKGFNYIILEVAFMTALMMEV